MNLLSTAIAKGNMITTFALFGLILSQFQRPVPVATNPSFTFEIGTPKASETFGTGFLPFRVSFTCNYDHLGPANGCVVPTRINMNRVIGGNLFYRGKQPISSHIDPIKEAEVHLVGVKVRHPQAEWGVPFAELHIDAQTFELASDVVSWYVHANWRDDQATMVDTFEVEVTGEVVWSTGIYSHIHAKNMACADSTSRCLSSLRFQNIEFPVVSAALGRFTIRNDASINGGGIAGLGSSVSFSASPPGTTTATAECMLVGSHYLDCEHRVIMLEADTKEAIPFVAMPYLYTSSGNPVPYAGGSTQPQPTQRPHREMACGIREFVSVTTNGSLGAFGGIHFGSHHNDCGFNGPNRYLGPGVWSYIAAVNHYLQIIDPASGSNNEFDSTFVLDGAKLLWP